MRLMEPYTTKYVPILKGPGTTRLFETMVEKSAMGYAEPRGPILKYTVEGSKGQPLEVNVEMIGNWKKVDGHYELNAAIGDGYVVVKDWLKTDEIGMRGSIHDI
jgi:hypothetical protein